jgi:hypothetical protein
VNRRRTMFFEMNWKTKTIRDDVIGRAFWRGSHNLEDLLENE